MVKVLFVRVCGGSTVAVELRPFTNAQSPQTPARQPGILGKSKGRATSFCREAAKFGPYAPTAPAARFPP